MIYKVRVKNSMFGYESDIIREIEANSPEEAKKKAASSDLFAECTVVGSVQ